MVWIDIVLLAIIIVSTVIGLIRGFIREMLSLLAWVIAFWVAITFSKGLSSSLGFFSDSDMVRMVAAFILLFLSTLVIAAVVNFLVAKLLSKAGMGGTDKVIGMVFGLARGVAVVGAGMVVGLVAGLDAEPWWGQSGVIEVLQPLANLGKSFIREV